MKRHFAFLPTLLLLAAIVAAGCNLVGPKQVYDRELEHYKEVTGGISYEGIHAPPSVLGVPDAPRTINANAAPKEWWNLSLDEAIQTAVTQSVVLRDLGGTVVRSPLNARTIMNPAIAASDPRYGMEAALSAFDANVATSVTAEKNDRMVNNFVSSGGTRFFQQDLVTFQSQITKLGAAGTQTTLRGTSIYDNNNATFNRFPSVWDTLVEAEVRQPLLQGAGVDFNRIAGPGAYPGYINGVVIARVNTDISIVDFELGLRDLVSNVENAYWDLYFAYRDLDAKIFARNAALDTWQRIRKLAEAGNPGGSAEREAQAREQYYRFEEDVQNALAGRLQDATITNNGSSGGSFRGTGGVLVAERRLRLAMGAPITDGRMIRPADEPTLASVSFSWPEISADALVRRTELRRSRLLVKRRELELIANRNFLLPQFDMIGRYRWRGLGHRLLGDTPIPFDPADPANHFSQSSLGNLFGGDFDEWLLGAEVKFPIGFRKAYAGVRNAQLLLAREKAVLEEQERQIMHDLSNVYAELQRTEQVMQTTYNRRLAGKRQVEILRDKLAKDIPVNLDTLLDAERRFADSDIQFHRSLVEHMLAIKNVNFERGTLLQYSHVLLAENIGADGQVRNEPPQPAANAELDYALSEGAPLIPSPIAASMPEAIDAAGSGSPMPAAGNGSIAGDASVAGGPTTVDTDPQPTPALRPAPSAGPAPLATPISIPLENAAASGAPAPSQLLIEQTLFQSDSRLPATVVGASAWASPPVDETSLKRLPSVE
jgi:outer membrane protein TolC